MTDVFGRSAEAWAGAHGLPLHLTWLPRVRENLRAFSGVFRELYPDGAVRYAVKASCHPALLAAVREEGAGADVASPFEARAALEAGMDPRALDLNGNCKEDALIREAVARDMLVVADSVEELALLQAAATTEGRTARVLLRLSGFELGPVTGEDIFTAGPWSKFGIPLGEIPGVLAALDTWPALRVLGFHTHIGSQITSPEPYLAVLGRMIDLGADLRARAGACRILNLGGGFPVNYLDAAGWEAYRRRLAARDGFCWNDGTGGLQPGPDGRLDPGAWRGEAYHSPWPKEAMLRAVLQGEVRAWGRTLGARQALAALGGPRLLVEPGRSIVEDAGATLCRVAHVRRTAGGHAFVTAEMGVLGHGDALLEGLPNRWSVAGGAADPEPFEAFIAGNLCFSGDLLSRTLVAFHRRPVRGDLLVARDTGAYTSHFIASNANAYPRMPRILLHGDGRETVMAERDRYEGLFPQPQGKR
ncbi:diaminopimelate decarboxylase family protein [Mesoterricola sediminis]|uniref:Diaminopimelate decarboxylase n=1 Tax=Mesoterricola sediminis TaxID=2927980 RepID=A0AA48KF31_9BACT|nr:alanine racemase [Mesoterricola sediminis]BDU77902.1 diaminopimelate decarboxylase [Mesoterricola sediminis]